MIVDNEHTRMKSRLHDYPYCYQCDLEWPCPPVAAQESEVAVEPMVITLNDILNGVRQDGEVVFPYEDAVDPEPMSGVTQLETPEALAAERAYKMAIADPTSVLNDRIVATDRKNRVRHKSDADIQAARDDYRRRAEARGVVFGADGGIVLPGNGVTS